MCIYYYYERHDFYYAAILYLFLLLNNDDVECIYAGQCTEWLSFLLLTFQLISYLVFLYGRSYFIDEGTCSNSEFSWFLSSYHPYPCSLFQISTEQWWFGGSCSSYCQCMCALPRSITFFAVLILEGLGFVALTLVHSNLSSVLPFPILVMDIGSFGISFAHMMFKRQSILMGYGVKI